LEVSETIHTGEQGSTVAARVAGVARAAPGEVSAGYAWRERPILMSAPMVRSTLVDLKRQTRRIAKAFSVTLRHAVASDLPPETGRHVVAKPRRYPATLNQNGAVSIVLDDGTKLGVKPGEFDFVCPYADGRTHLGDYGGARKAWTVMPSPLTAQRLWVRERIERVSAGLEHAVAFGDQAVYAADGALTKLDTWPWKRSMLPGIHCPRGLSRITLQVTDVRLQRLQDITDDDARAEGLIAITKDGHLVKYGIPDRDGLPGTDNDGWPWQEWDVSPREAFLKLWDRINGEREPWSANPWVWAVSFRRLTP
jgi:hypothetical protein